MVRIFKALGVAAVAAVFGVASAADELTAVSKCAAVRFRCMNHTAKDAA